VPDAQRSSVRAAGGRTAAPVPLAQIAGREAAQISGAVGRELMMAGWAAERGSLLMDRSNTPRGLTSMTRRHALMRECGMDARSDPVIHRGAKDSHN